MLNWFQHLIKKEDYCLSVQQAGAAMINSKNQIPSKGHFDMSNMVAIEKSYFLIGSCRFLTLPFGRFECLQREPIENFFQQSISEQSLNHFSIQF
ncbi:hypothetical protein GGE08_001262 [Muricauda sp. ARW1Y1]|nr:hypothetical protein [Muricauda sp. ARW1Y1]